MMSDKVNGAETGAPARNDDTAWMAPLGARLPDFMICGAMKCGTTTVHALLGKHPEVFIPDPEINFFDMDDIFQHPDFTFHGPDGWSVPDICSKPEQYWTWYQSHYRNAPAGSLVGEDSTCYLPSDRAARRIAMQDKPIKTIICLRHPTNRTYSQYWHMLHSGRAMFDFEDTIRFLPNQILERSMYRPQIERFLCHVPREQVYFFVLEDFLADRTRVIGELCAFLGLDPAHLPQEAASTHANRGNWPRNPGLRAFKNRMLRRHSAQFYTASLPFNSGPSQPEKPGLFPRVATRLHDMVNPPSAPSAPKMLPETRRFLDAFFRRELEGLGELIGKDVESLWFDPGQRR